MALKVAFQMDPIERIDIRGNSTFALLLEAQWRGHDVFYYTPNNLSLRDGKLIALGHSLTVEDKPGDHYRLAHQREEDLSKFDVVHLRQDPPFDMAYITTTHLLERIHPKTLVVNNPAAVRNAPEKVFVLDFLDLMPPTLVTRSPDAIRAFRDKHKDIVVKPLYGNGGAAVFHVPPGDTNLNSLIELLGMTFREPIMVQRYLPRGARAATSASSWSTARSQAPSTACLRPTRRAPISMSAAGPSPPRSRPRQGDLRAARARAQEARADLRRHRRDRRLPHRDQRHLADRHPPGGAVRRPRHRRHDLGRDRGEGEAREEAMTGKSKSFGEVFDAHTAAEFQTRDIEATMATMGETPHVTHVPVMTGGHGADAVRSFYETWFIGHWPEDTKITLVSRTAGESQLVDELILSFTHDCEMPAILPGIKPTGRKVTVPTVVIVGFDQDDKITHEHIYWDQATMLVQLGLLDPSALPVTGAEQAARLLDPKLASNTLIPK